MRSRAIPLKGGEDILVRLDYMIDKAMDKGVDLDPGINPMSKWSLLISSRREIAEQRQEIQRLRTLLRISGIAYTKAGPAVPLVDGQDPASPEPERIRPRGPRTALHQRKLEAFLSPQPPATL